MEKLLMHSKRRLKKGLVICLILAAYATRGVGADLDLKAIFREGTPSSPFINVVYRYADAMLQNGRDTYGPQKSGLFLSAFDRETLAPLTIQPPAPAGIRQENRPGPADGPLVGGNPQLDQNLLRLLYFLKEMSGQERYAQAADDELKWFLKNTQSPETGLLPWGEHLCWNVMSDEVACGLAEPLHEFARPWMLWGRCFELAPEESKRFALGLWNSHIADHNSGAFNPHADFYKGPAETSPESPRQAGFYIRTWAEAYAHTKDNTFLKAIGVLLTRLDAKCTSKTEQTKPEDTPQNACDILSLAIDCDGAARKVPPHTSGGHRTRLARFAESQDEIFCSLPHELASKRGFVTRCVPAAVKTDDLYTPLWDPKYGGNTTARVAMMCVSRYENTGNVKYRDLIIAAADAYMDSLPDDDIDAWPMTFGQAVSLELAAFRATARREYYTRAFKLGEIAVEKFFANTPLPRASLKTNHYESTTGADTLVLALAELHLTVLHITAVRSPANTIDR